MRLEQVEVNGFGSLCDLRVDFHPRVTVIFGDNESGKSTLHRAIRAALYGIDSGGQGRAVERSDWQRWRPWSASRYGLSLTYLLADGRRLRVARRLDTREQSVQVVELGGRDVTDELRVARMVVPGRFHLGVDEAVFCATAWVGEDGLRLASMEAAGQRAGELQEAIERIADTGGGVTAARAIALLRQAIDRVGSERRLTSPLGVAAARVRELDHTLREARARVATVAHEQERLAELEAAAAAAGTRLLSAERAWLTGRLADLADRRRLLEAAAAEQAEHERAIAATTRFAAFRTDDEDRVIALGAELTQATLTAAEAAKRWEASSEGRETVRRRRGEIMNGLRALAPLVPSVPVDERAVRELHAELAAAAASWARLDTSSLIQERRAALQREIAATGFGDLAPATLDALSPLLEPARGRGVTTRLAAALVAPLPAVAAGVVLALGRHLTASVAAFAVATAVLVLAVVWASRTRRSGRAERQKRLRAMQGAGLGAEELERLADRLPSLRALRAALLREQALAQSRRLDAEALQDEAATVHARCAALAAAGGMEPGPAPRAPATADVYLDAAREALGRIDTALAAQQRRAELVAEDSQLAMTEAAQQQLFDDLGRAKAAVADGAQRLRAILAVAGITASLPPGEAVAAFRQACAERRRHDEAVRAADQVHRRIAALGADSAVLERSSEHFAAELRARGGDPDDAAAQPPAGADELRALESEAERAKREAAAAHAEARALRARLSTLLDSMPDLADLEDERSACAAARERGLAQLAALQRAVELVEEATRGAHRELAPRLADSLEARMHLLTDGRYTGVNVDTDHFQVSLLCEERPDFVALELASQGTRDQVSLLLRLALCEVLSGAGEPAPLLLDDPLRASDPRRRHVALEFLLELSATHQVVLTTSSPGVVDELSAMAGDLVSVVPLGEARVVETTGRLLRQSIPAMRTKPSSSDTSSVKSGSRAIGTSPPNRSSLPS